MSTFSRIKTDLLGVGTLAVVVSFLAITITSGAWQNFVMMVLYATLLAQAWNILGGYGGQFSFGHSLFFGVGAYAQIIAQLQWGMNPYTALLFAGSLAVLVALWVGFLSFRYGLKGSYFALVTLAFAEVFRIVSFSVPFTGAGVGLMLPLKTSAANLQFESKSGFIFVALAFVLLAFAITLYLKHSRLGAYLQAVRDNEDAARAVGVHCFRTKLIAIALSGFLMSLGGAFYVQVFQYIDPTIAFGATSSVEALVAAIVGGIGTLWGPLLGALVLHGLSDITRNLFGQLPGINWVIYGVVLVTMVIFLPRGLMGGLQSLQARLLRSKEVDK